MSAFHNFKLGDTVRWVSQAGGYRRAKHGEIVAVVDPYVDPRNEAARIGRALRDVGMTRRGDRQVGQIAPQEVPHAFRPQRRTVMSHQPDEVVARTTGGDFEPHPEGQVAALCVDVVDLGERVEDYQGTTRVAHKVALIFASEARQKDLSLALITTEMTNSASEKGNLRKFLESWRGKSYTPEQIQAGLPLHKLHGQAGLLTIEHVTTAKGHLFAKIRSISPLPPVMPAPQGVLDEYERPKFLTDKKAAYAEALRKHREKELAEEADHAPDLPGDESSLPF